MNWTVSGYAILHFGLIFLFGLSCIGLMNWLAGKKIWYLMATAIWMVVAFSSFNFAVSTYVALMQNLTNDRIELVWLIRIFIILTTIDIFILFVGGIYGIKLSQKLIRDLDDFRMQEAVQETNA